LPCSLYYINVCYGLHLKRRRRGLEIEGRGGRGGKGITQARVPLPSHPRGVSTWFMCGIDTYVPFENATCTGDPAKEALIA
jgi:hypothetical protein